MKASQIRPHAALLIGALLLLNMMAVSACRTSTANTTSLQTTSLSVVDQVDQKLRLGDTLVVDDFFEFTVTRYSFTKLIEPPDPKDLYKFYETNDPDKIYLDMIVRYKNRRSTAIPVPEAASVTFFFSKAKGFAGTAIMEEPDGTDFTFPDSTAIKPDETRILHYFAEVPIAYQAGSQSIDAIIGVNKRHYNFSLR